MTYCDLERNVFLKLIYTMVFGSTVPYSYKCRMFYSTNIFCGNGVGMAMDFVGLGCEWT